MPPDRDSCRESVPVYRTERSTGGRRTGVCPRCRGRLPLDEHGLIPAHEPLRVVDTRGLVLSAWLR